MLHIYRELVKAYGVEPSIEIIYKAGNSVYKSDRDLIKVYCDPAAEYAEHVFTLLHEYRHALQVAMKLFPDMMDMEKFNFTLKHSDYFEVPWEREANDWAWRQGLKMGFWDNQWKPRFLYGRPVGDLK